jgi:hypothetical protein
MKSALTTERKLFHRVQKQYSEGNILTQNTEATEIIKIVRCPIVITIQLFLLQYQNKV